MQDAVHDMRVYANDRIGYQQTGLEAENIKVFKAAKLVNFMYMIQHMYTLDDISELKVFPFLCHGRRRRNSDDRKG